MTDYLVCSKNKFEIFSSLYQRLEEAFEPEHNLTTLSHFVFLQTSSFMSLKLDQRGGPFALVALPFVL